MQVQQANHYRGLGASHSTVATRWRPRLQTRFCKTVVTAYSENCGHASLGNSPRPNTAQLHAVLGVGPGASKTEVKRAYRRLALKYHPDVCRSDEGHIRFLHIKAAYDSIMNPTDLAIKPPSQPSATQSGCHWCGEAGPDDWFSAPYYSTSEEAPTYDPWWEVLQESMSRSTDGSVRTDSDFSDDQGVYERFSRQSISWEDW